MLIKKKTTNKDYDIILNIWEESVKKTHHFLSKEDFEFYKKIFPNYLDDTNLLLWEDDTKIVGFSGTNEQELVMLFLNPECIGQKYGSRILKELIEIDHITNVDVNTQNTSAKAFYLSHGFEVESEDKLDGFDKPYPISHLIRKH